MRERKRKRKREKNPNYSITQLTLNWARVSEAQETNMLSPF